MLCVCEDDDLVDRETKEHWEEEELHNANNLARKASENEPETS